MAALPVCVGLLSRLPVKELRALYRIGAVKGQQDDTIGDEEDVPRSGKGLGGLTVYDQDESGGKDDDGQEAERKLKVEAAKALKRKKVAVYRQVKVKITT